MQENIVSGMSLLSMLHLVRVFLTVSVVSYLLEDWVVFKKKNSNALWSVAYQGLGPEGGVVG